MALNPQELSEHPCTIADVRTQVQEGLVELLSVSIERKSDKNKGIISYCHIDYYGEDSDSERTPEVIRALYEDFNIKDALELIGREVIGVYFMQERLVGMRRA